MKYTSIFEKIQCVGELISGSIIYPIFLGIFALLVILLFINKIKNRKVIILMAISYLILLIITICSNYNALSDVFDSIATNIFTNIYFPSTHMYLFTLILVDIVTACSFLNVKCDKVYRISNGICFFVTNFIMVLILEVVSKNEIDIFSKESLFSNVDLVMLLELSIGIFIIWLLSLAVIYITDKVTERLVDTNEKTVKVANNSNTLVVDNVKEEVNIVPELQNKQPSTVSAVSNIKMEPARDSFNLNDLNISSASQYVDPTSQYMNNSTSYIVPDYIVPEVEKSVDLVQNNVNDNVDSNILLDKLLHNGLPVIKDNEKEINSNHSVLKDSHDTNVKKDYTLNDYRIFNKMLKEVKEMNNGNIINIDRDLEYKLILKYSKEEYNLFKGMLKNYSN